MKTLALLLFFIISSINGIISQDIPKGANLITFTSNSLKNFDLFKECILILKKEGYTFDQLDKDFNLCSTKPIQDKASQYRIDLSVNDNKIEIRSYVKLNGSTTTRTPWGTEYTNEETWERGANRSLSRSLWRHGWDKQIDLAVKIKEKISGTINYTVEEKK